MGAKLNRVGEKGVSNEGYSMEIVAYRGANDIDVLVDGKYLRKNRNYVGFKSGTIAAFKQGSLKGRLGEKNTSNEGYPIEIVDYRSTRDVDILVDGRHLAKCVPYQAFKLGSISNPYHRTMCGVGYLGEGKYTSVREGGKDEAYKFWHSMFNRLYNEKHLSRNPSYKGCTVDERFHNFQEFAKWFEENYYTVGTERMTLDKDILVKGNRVYSPDTCMFVPVRVNALFIRNRSQRGGLPMGVYKHHSKYRACISMSDSKLSLGTFDTPEEAFHAYKTVKEAYIKEVADEYKARIPQKLYDALYAYTIEITD